MMKKKRLSVIITSLIVSLFIGWNFYLLYGKESVIPKIAYVSTYEVVKEDEYERHFKNDGLVVPEEIVTMYMSEEDAIDQWLVKEGDEVEAGDELVLLQTERMEGMVETWTAERDALMKQRDTVSSTVSYLEKERKNATYNTSDTNSTKANQDTNVELNVNMAIDVHQDGAFAQAIAEAERELANIERQLTVLEHQINQSSIRPAIISPVDGIVAELRKHEIRPSLDVYSTETQVATYVTEKEWESIEAGDQSTVHFGKYEEKAEGSIALRSLIPALESRTFEAYQAFDQRAKKNPLDFYEVRVALETAPPSVPFGKKVSVDVTTDYTPSAIGVPEKWYKREKKDRGMIQRITTSGKVVPLEVESEFVSDDKRVVLRDGLYDHDVVIPLLPEKLFEQKKKEETKKKAKKEDVDQKEPKENEEEVPSEDEPVIEDEEASVSTKSKFAAVSEFEEFNEEAAARLEVLQSVDALLLTEQDREERAYLEALKTAKEEAEAIDQQMNGSDADAESPEEETGDAEEEPVDVDDLLEQWETEKVEGEEEMMDEEADVLEEGQRIAIRYPLIQPSNKTWKSFGWKNYIRYMIQP